MSPTKSYSSSSNGFFLCLTNSQRQKSPPGLLTAVVSKAKFNIGLLAVEKIIYKETNIVPISSGFQLDATRWVVEVLGFLCTVEYPS